MLNLISKGEFAMKKLITLSLAVILIFALCACGKTASNEPEETDNGGNTQMVNPMVEVTPTELENAIGVALVPPEGANDTMFFLIGGNMGEVRFKYGTTNEEYTYRVQKTDEFQDISGVYISSGSKTEIDYISTPALTVNVDESGSMGAATWFDNGYSYSISMGEGAATEALAEMYHLVYSGE